MQKPFPFKPGDWVASRGDHRNVGKVKDVYRDPGSDEAVLLDLVLYDRDGSRIGRKSPACGGPSGFEPACAADYWERITPPLFPVSLQWVPDGDGSIARYVAGTVLPPANYLPRTRTPRKAAIQHDDQLRRALEAIAGGHNDPRALARAALGL